MGRRKATNGDTNGDTPDWRLTPQQYAAVDLLTSGKTLTATAEVIGVGRPAVSDWVNHHSGFIAALNSRRQELWDSVVDELRGLLPQAVSVLKKELEGEAPLPAAIQVLKLSGIAAAGGRPIGPTTPEDADLAIRQRASDRLMAELSVLASGPC